MLSICEDIVRCIGCCLSDKSKVRLIETCSVVNGFKHLFVFDKKVEFESISNLSYYDQFLHVVFKKGEHRLPRRIEKIRYRVIDNYVLPYATHIHFAYYADCYVPLPASVVSIELPDTFNSPPMKCESCTVPEICSHIPNTITHLRFGTIFNRSIDSPNLTSLTHLTFGDCYNQPLDFNLFSSLTHLTFGSAFNQPIIGMSVLTKLTHLTFGVHFDQIVKDNIPESVTNLHFDRYFNQNIDNCIPYSVTCLSFFGNFNKHVVGLPNTITHLSLRGEFNQTLTAMLPDSITHLTLGDRFNKPLNNSIPASVICLTFGYDFNHPLAENDLINVQHVTFGVCFRQSLKNVRMPKMIYLTSSKRSSIADVPSHVICNMV